MFSVGIICTASKHQESRHWHRCSVVNFLSKTFSPVIRQNFGHKGSAHSCGDCKVKGWEHGGRAANLRQADITEKRLPVLHNGSTITPKCRHSVEAPASSAKNVPRPYSLPFPCSICLTHCWSSRPEQKRADEVRALSPM